MPDLSAAVKRQPALPRFLCHLYQRLRAEKLNLVTGAGISIDAKVPSWFDLLARLAEHCPTLPADLKQHREAGLTPEYLGQIIYHRHRTMAGVGVDATAAVEAEINHNWAGAIHKAIYKDVADNIATVVSNHPYFAHLRDLAMKVPLVINFNFDDLLAEAIGSDVSHAAADPRRFSVVWRPPLVDRIKHTTIYHVNGVLPRVSLKKRSPQLIFTEDSFADAMARAPGVNAEYILLRFVQNTMLIIGHSLNDVSLKDYLRKNRDRSPANHHYMIYWLDKSKPLSEDRQADIFDANLALYNVITIFLCTEEISSFLKALNMSESDFKDFIENNGIDRLSTYHYYIAGPVAAGKSTVLEHLRCFETYEEWTRPPPPEMYRSFKSLSDAENEVVDKFVYRQIKEKNELLSRASVGFHFMDRAPLDLYAFSQDDGERKQKTKDLDDQVVRIKSLQNGEIVFLSAEGGELVQRNLRRGRSPDDAGDAGYLDEQTKKLQALYSPEICIATDRLPAEEIARNIARHVLLKEYKPVNLDRIMEGYRK